MSTFDDREKAFEDKFAHDAEMQFKAEARRNKLLGLWAAELLGKSGEDANAYAAEVVKADLQEILKRSKPSTLVLWTQAVICSSQTLSVAMHRV
ncbi:MAG: DUF1476 domain-containing protein [Marivivens sp.]|nr:DUF1476 domain-containing protein [Marivivens sp.]